MPGGPFTTAFMRTCSFAIGLLAVVCCASLCAEPSGTNHAARAVVTPPAREHFHIYLLMGQSNMAGRDTRALASQLDNPRVLALDERGRWVVAHDPIFPQRGRIQPGAGPGIPFALKMLAADTNLTIGLVPCAVGGTALRRWVKGGDLYERALTLARSAAQSGVIKGVLWHQGESDSDQEENTKTYEARLTQMFKDLRADLDQPHLPIVVGQLGEFLSPKEHPYAPVVRAALQHVPTVLDDLGYADSAGLGDKGDHLHFSAAAAKALGERYAAAMRHLLDVQSQLASAMAVVDVWPAGRMPGRGADEPESFSSPEKTDARRITNVSHPTLTVFPGPRPHSPTLIVCPGGAYKYVVMDKEGTEIASWLNSLGMGALVLKYRVPHNREGALQDVQRALSLARARAAEWNIDPRRLGVIGFSAGGNLAARASTQFGARRYPVIDAVDEQSCRPDFTVLVYPAYLDDGAGHLSPDLNLSADIPPTLIIHNEDDPTFVAGSKLYHAALDAVQVPNQFVLYATGGHGYGLRCEKDARAWPGAAADWLRSLLAR